jgi:hypothetical protein
MKSKKYLPCDRRFCWDFQAEWESPAVGLFHGAAFSTAQLPTNSAIQPFFSREKAEGPLNRASRVM